MIIHYLFLFLLAPFGISLWGMENNSEEITINAKSCFIIGELKKELIYPQVIFVPDDIKNTFPSSTVIDLSDGKLVASVNGRFYLINNASGAQPLKNKQMDTHVNAFFSRNTVYHCVWRDCEKILYTYNTSNEVTHSRTKYNGELEFFKEDNANKQHTKQNQKSCIVIGASNGYIALFVPTSDIPSTTHDLDNKTKITNKGIEIDGEPIKGKFLNIKGENIGVASSGIVNSYNADYKIKLDHANVDQQSLIGLKEMNIENILPSAKQQPQKTSNNHSHTPSLNKNNQNNNEQTNTSDDIPTHQSSFLAWIKTRFNHVVYGKKIKETLCFLGAGACIHELPKNFKLNTHHQFNINHELNESKEVKKQTLKIYDIKLKKEIHTHTASPMSENKETYHNDQNSSKPIKVTLYYTEKSLQEGHGDGFLTETPREKLDYTERWIFGTIGIAVATATIYALSGKTYQYNKQI